MPLYVLFEEDSVKMNSFVKLSLLFLISVTVFSCGTVPPKPKWAEQTGHATFNNSLILVGRSDGKATEKEAENSAFISALADLNLYFGVSVSAQMEDVESETDGVYSYAIKSKNTISGAPVKVNKFNKTNVFVEKKDGGYSGYVQISIPMSEVSRIDKEIKGLTGFAVIVSKPEYVTVLSDFARQWAQAKGLKISGNASEISKDATVEDIMSVSDSAYFLAVIAEFEEPTQSGKVFYTRVKITLRQISLIEKRELATVTEELKWGEYSAEEAVSKGFKKLIQNMLGRQ